MKKIKTFLIVFAVTFIFCFSMKYLNIKAETNDLKNIGTYMRTVPVNKTIKVYIQKDLKPYLEENGITVYSENRGGWWFIKDYYYIANKYVDKIVETRLIKNDIDSLIFMIDELENVAKTIDANQYKNITLGYIRSFNDEYVDDYFGKWSVMAGSIDENAIRLINEKESQKIGLRLYEYFAQFVCYNDGENNYKEDNYNKNLHGEVREVYRNKNNEVLKLIDPATKTKGIDLIHLFASIDGIYSKTQAGLLSLGNKMENDIVSWNGDLQQAIKNIYTLIEKQKANKEEVLDLNDPNYKKMNLIFSKDSEGNDRFCCPEEDILADIDAMNVTKIFVDHDNTTIANALRGYYELILNDYHIRFKTFLKTILIDEEKKEDIKNKSEIERFELEVANQFNVKIDKNNGENVYSGYNYHDSKIFIGFAIMRDGNFTSAKFLGTLPSDEVRIFVVESFIDYVESNM